MPVVQGIVPVRAAPGGMQFDLQLLSGLAGFDHVVAAGEVLAGGGVQGDSVASDALPPLVAPGQPQASYRMR